MTTETKQDYRNGNYVAFYVKEPFDSCNLEANSTKDFVSYRLLQAWKEKDSTFPFIDSHNKTYNVRDDSDWETTLKPRLHERLKKSKNIILFLSSITIESRALKEEIEYGINILELPVIVVYLEYSEKSDIVTNGSIKENIKKLWDLLPVFKNNMAKVPTIHVPMKKELIKVALENDDFKVQTKKENGIFIYNIKQFK